MKKGFLLPAVLASVLFWILLSGDAPGKGTATFCQEKKTLTREFDTVIVPGSVFKTFLKKDIDTMGLYACCLGQSGAACLSAWWDRDASYDRNRDIKVRCQEEIRQV